MNYFFVKEEYYIQNNGGVPYKVICDIIDGKNIVDIYQIDQQATKKTDDIVFKKKSILTYYPKNVFVGHSPKNSMTEFSGGYGKEWDGNTILLHIDTNKYIFIYRTISSFESISNITSFISPIGNNSVPYPYAIDEYNNYYLLSEDVIIKSPNLEGYDNPYNYYYDYSLLTDDYGYVKPKRCKKIFNNIITFLCCNEHSTLRYNPFPEHKNTYCFQNKNDLYIIDTNNNKIKFSWDNFKTLMNEVASTYGFVPLNMNVINDSDQNV